MMGCIEMASEVDQLVELLEGVTEDALRTELRELEKRANLIRAALRFKEEESQPGASGGTAAESSPVNLELSPATARSHATMEITTPDAPITMRQAVLTLLAENPNRPRKQAEIRQALMRRGWMPPDESRAHYLGVVLSKLARNGELERPERGYYKLPTRDRGAEP
jgi:hypothetical protein